MSNRVSIKLNCPKCGNPSEASIKEHLNGILIFVCPHCQSNVVYYDNKIDIISDGFLNKLIKKHKLKTCGIINLPVPLPQPQYKRPISKDDVIDLKIALETTDSVDTFINNI